MEEESSSSETMLILIALRMELLNRLTLTCPTLGLRHLLCTATALEGIIIVCFNIKEVVVSEVPSFTVKRLRD